MPSVNTICGNLFSTSTQRSWGNPALYEPKEIIIPFKPVPRSQAKALYDKKVNKQEKIQQLKEIGISQSEIDFMLTMDDWGEIHVNPSKRTVIIGDLNGNRVENTYNSKGQSVKQVNYYGKKKQVEEFKNGYRIFTEYEMNDKGQYVKKYYEKSPEDNFENIIEKHSY